MSKHVGVSTGSVVESPARRRRRDRQRRQEEAMWRALNGPVRVYVDESVRRGSEASDVR